MENIDTPTPQLEDLISAAIGRAWEATGLAKEMEAETSRLFGAFTEIGDQAYERLQKKDKDPLSEAEELSLFQITFEWADRAKAYLLLWRDVMFQLQRAQIMNLDGGVGAEAIDKLKDKSRQTLTQAAADLSEQLRRARRIPEERWNTLKKRKRGQWRLQNNPWPVYREQMKKLPGQCSDLLTSNRQLREASDVFSSIRGQIGEMESACRKEIDKTAAVVNRTIAMIESEIAEDPTRSLGKIAALLEDIEAEHPLPHHLHTFVSKLEKQMDALPGNLRIAVSIKDSLLEVKELNLRRRVKQWLESEVIPLIYEAWEVAESTYNGMKMALVNIRNRALLLSAGSREGKAPDYDPADLSQPLVALKGTEKEAIASLDELAGLIEGRMAASFRLSLIYDTTQYFLPVPLQSTINQLQLDQNKILVRVRRWINRRRVAIKRFRRSVEQEEALSISEKVVRYIDNWQGEPDNSHYTSIFLTRGYIGESFSVGRQQEIGHVGNIVRQWKNGFRGSIAITGQRFAGKTLFGEMVANRFFPDNTIRLIPGETVQVQGRKMKATYDLREALEFIRKYTLNVRPLIWLDDLELWWDTSIPLYKNIRALTKFIDNYAHNIFFMVSMSNSLKVHMQLFTAADHTFQASLNMDYMTASEVRQAILIRHGATHQKLVDQSGQELTPAQFNKITQQVYRSARGNIGDALMRWSGTTQRLDEDHVVNKFAARYSLPDFLETDSAMLLASVMLQKRTNEYRLRKLFGPAFSDKYRSALQRLINVSILQRQLDGWLEINELTASDVGYLLERKKFLRYRSR